MAKKNVKIFSEYMSYTIPVKELTVSYTFEEDKSFDIHVKNYMTIDEKSTFVDRVVNGCFDSDENYHPEFRNAIFQITILQMLTDAPVFSYKSDEIDENRNPTGNKVDVIDIDKTYNLCRCLNLYEKVQNDVFTSLYEELSNLVTEKIVFKQQRILMGEKKTLDKARNDIENGLALINSIAEKLNETLSQNIQQGDTISAVNRFSKRIENISDKQLLDAILRE